MKFCKQCDNMLYFKMKEEENKLYYYCRKCGDEEVIEKTELIKDVTYEKKQNKIVNVNKNIKYDPTIPHIKNMNCPNESCLSNKSDVKKDIIYYRYNEDDIKYIYMCVNCDTMWEPKN